MLDCSGLEPQITWGTDPSQVLGISGRVPDPSSAADRQPARRDGKRARLHGTLQPGMALAGLPVNRVFIGSCTNARLPDLQAAADVVRGRRVAQGVVAMVVPGSTTVKREAEAAGLDRVFRDAGFFWGESGCSMCAGGNGDRGEPGERCVSTTNRNFENRQGTEGAHPSGQPGDRGRNARSPAASPTCGKSKRGAPDAAVHQPHRHRRPAAADDVNTDQVAPVQAMRDIKPGLQEAAVHAQRAPRNRTSC